MAIRQVREIGDDILTKQCKDVPRMTLRTKILIGDMLETMYEYHGVGLTAGRSSETDCCHRCGRRTDRSDQS